MSNKGDGGTVIIFVAVNNNDCVVSCGCGVNRTLSVIIDIGNVLNSFLLLLLSNTVSII